MLNFLKHARWVRSREDRSWCCFPCVKQNIFLFFFFGLGHNLGGTLGILTDSWLGEAPLCLEAWLVHRDNQRPQRWLWWAGSNYSSGITIRTFSLEGKCKRWNEVAPRRGQRDGDRVSMSLYVFIYFLKDWDGQKVSDWLGAIRGDMR